MMHSTSSITNDVWNLVQNIENRAVKEFQTACSDVVINLNLRDNFGRPITTDKLKKMISGNKKVNTFLFDEISKQTIAVFTIITQGTPRVIYSNLSVRKKFLYQVQIIQNILTEEFGAFEDDDSNSSLLVQISMNDRKRRNPQLVLKNIGYNSTVTIGLLTMNAASTIFDPNFLKICGGYLFFFPVFPFILFFGPWPLLLVFPVSMYMFMTIYKTLTQLVEQDD
jgi:hypothetical protein